jgi:hypothetical protein
MHPRRRRAATIPICLALRTYEGGGESGASLGLRAHDDRPPVCDVPFVRMEHRMRTNGTSQVTQRQSERCGAGASSYAEVHS